MSPMSRRSDINMLPSLLMVSVAPTQESERVSYGSTRNYVVVQRNKTQDVSLTHHGVEQVSFYDNIISGQSGS